MWDVSAEKLTSPVISFSLGDGSGEDMPMKDLSEEFKIDLDISPHLIPPVQVVRSRIL